MILPILEIPEELQKLCAPYESLFSKPQFLQFERFITALMVSNEADIEALSEGYKATQSYDRLHHFVSKSSWDINDVLSQTVSVIKNLPQGQRFREDGMLVLDDSLIEKYGQFMEGTGKLYDHSKARYLNFAHCLVCLLYANHKSVRYPLQFELYKKEEDCLKENIPFRTKIIIGKELINWAVSKGILFQTVVFDSWFFSQELVSQIEGLGKDWITMAKSDRNIIVKGETMHVGTYAATLQPEGLEETIVEGKRYRVKSLKIRVPSLKSALRKFRLVVSFEEKPKEKGGGFRDPVFLVSNRLDIRPERLIRAYQTRWSIETFFRDAKNELGLEDYQMRKLKGIKSHWCLVFTSAVFLELVRLQVCQEKSLTSPNMSFGQLRQRAFGRSLKSIISWSLMQSDRGLSAEDIFMKLKI